METAASNGRVRESNESGLGQARGTLKGRVSLYLSLDTSEGRDRIHLELAIRREGIDMPMIESELFANLSVSALNVLAGQASEKTFAAYDAVFHEGEEAEYVYVLIEGTVHLTMGDAEDLCFTVENNGQTFGWSALLEPYRYRATARCMTAARLLAIPRAAIIDIEKTYPQDGTAIFKNLATILIERLRNAYQEVLSEPDLEGIASATVDQTLLRRG